MNDRLFLEWELKELRSEKSGGFIVFLLGFNIFIIVILFAIVRTSSEWNVKYRAQGRLFVPQSGIEEHFDIWFDPIAGLSRIDYHFGGVRTFHQKNNGQYGRAFKIIKALDGDVKNVTRTNETEICHQFDGIENCAVKIQSVLPAIENFRNDGTEIMHGLKCDRFVFEKQDGAIKFTKTLWIRYDVLKSVGKAKIPIRYEFKAYNEVLRFEVDRYYLVYDSFERVNYFPSGTFEIDSAINCKPSTDQQEHFMTFNPIGELIHPASSDYVNFEFEKFKNKYSKTYANQTVEEHRKRIFRDNLRFVNSKNRAGLSFSLAVNHLADRSDDEIDLRLRYRLSRTNSGLTFRDISSSFPNGVAPPDELDWRQAGAVTSVKDQGDCGSSWAFGTIGALEGAYFVKTNGTLVNLSVQALMDCLSDFEHDGCHGGAFAFDWISKMGGLPSEETYGPYVERTGQCHINGTNLVAPIRKFIRITSNDPYLFKMVMWNYGPLAVAINASQRTFRFYSRGVYLEPRCSQFRLDHMALAVGYGLVNDTPYWIVKNSWSRDWGNDGFILMSAVNGNNCGVMTAPIYVEL